MNCVIMNTMKTRRRKSFRGRHASRRAGFVIVVVVVLFAVSLALFGIWAQAAIGQHRRLRNEQLRLQAVRLAEAGVSRALARRAADPQYMKETWSVPASALGGPRAAEVRIRIEPTADDAALRVEATAEYPAGATRRAQITRRIEIPNTRSESEP